jgi:hypothetical protein
MSSDPIQPRPELHVGKRQQDRVSVGICRAGLHAGCYVSYYTQPTTTPVWYLIEFSGPACAVKIEDSDYSFFDEDEVEMKRLLEESDVVWFAEDKAQALLRQHFPQSRPGLIGRFTSWVRQGFG